MVKCLIVGSIIDSSLPLSTAVSFRGSSQFERLAWRWTLSGITVFWYLSAGIASGWSTENCHLGTVVWYRRVKEVAKHRFPNEYDGFECKDEMPDSNRLPLLIRGPIDAMINEAATVSLQAERCRVDLCWRPVMSIFTSWIYILAANLLDSQKIALKC